MKINKNVTVAGIIFLYCLFYAMLRLSVSSTMELDESEQFLNGSFLSLGYANQPPFYSWLVFGISRLLGLNIQTLIVTKYIIMFFFFFSFFLIARSLWDSRASLFITGSLLFFHTYSYEFNRDLSHSILVATMAAITCYLFIRLLRGGRLSDYLFFGAAIGLGFLSKYNFAVFLLALVLSALSFHEGRAALFNRKTVFSVIVCALIVSPHLLWLLQNDFMSFRHAMTKAAAGELQLSTVQKTFRIIAAAYSGVLVFLVIFFVLFKSSFSWAYRKSLSASHLRLFFSYLTLFGMAMPLLAIVVLKTGRFSERWLAPLLFSLPLGLFSAVDTEAANLRLKLLGYFSVVIVIGIFSVRALIGFSPDLIGKGERIHTPFNHLGLQLKQEHQKHGIKEYQHLTVAAESEFLSANIVAYLPGSRSYVMGSSQSKVEGSVKTNLHIVIWDAKKHGVGMPEKFCSQFPSVLPLGTFKAPFLRSSKSPPFALGTALAKD